jgi:hypothetical protein
VTPEGWTQQAASVQTYSHGTQQGETAGKDRQHHRLCCCCSPPCTHYIYALVAAYAVVTGCYTHVHPPGCAPVSSLLTQLILLHALSSLPLAAAAAAAVNTHGVRVLLAPQVCRPICSLLMQLVLFHAWLSLAAAAASTPTTSYLLCLLTRSVPQSAPSLYSWYSFIPV